METGEFRLEPESNPIVENLNTAVLCRLEVQSDFDLSFFNAFRCTTLLYATLLCSMLLYATLHYYFLLHISIWAGRASTW